MVEAQPTVRAGLGCRTASGFAKTQPSSLGTACVLHFRNLHRDGRSTRGNDSLMTKMALRRLERHSLSARRNLVRQYCSSFTFP